MSVIAEELHVCLRQQKYQTKFSFSEIMNNTQLEEMVNRKMESYERK